MRYTLLEVCEAQGLMCEQVMYCNTHPILQTYFFWSLIHLVMLLLQYVTVPQQCPNHTPQTEEKRKTT
jgi:hypothetical protein